MERIEVPIRAVFFTPDGCSQKGGTIRVIPAYPLPAGRTPVLRRLTDAEAAWDGVEYPLDRQGDGSYQTRIPHWSGYCMAY